MIKKYYWSIFHFNIEVYVKSCELFLALKIIKHKLYNDFESLSILIYDSKVFFINLITGVSFLANWKRKNYNFILVIIDWLIKIPYYALIKTNINALGLAKIIINVLMQYHRLSDFIINKRDFF